MTMPKASQWTMMETSWLQEKAEQVVPVVGLLQLAFRGQNYLLPVTHLWSSHFGGEKIDNNTGIAVG